MSGGTLLTLGVGPGRRGGAVDPLEVLNNTGVPLLMLLGNNLGTVGTNTKVWNDQSAAALVYNSADGRDIPIISTGNGKALQLIDGSSLGYRLDAAGNLGVPGVGEDLIVASAFQLTSITPLNQFLLRFYNSWALQLSAALPARVRLDTGPDAEESAAVLGTGLAWRVVVAHYDFALGVATIFLDGVQVAQGLSTSSAPVAAGSFVGHNIGGSSTTEGKNIASVYMTSGPGLLGSLGSVSDALAALL